MAGLIARWEMEAMKRDRGESHNAYYADSWDQFLDEGDIDEYRKEVAKANPPEIEETSDEDLIAADEADEASCSPCRPYGKVQSDWMERVKKDESK